MTLPVVDLFVLSMLQRGLGNAYQLRKQTAMSLGAAVPSLRRLEQKKFVRRIIAESSGHRPRHDYEVTAQGKQQLRTAWKELIRANEKPTDLDALLRVADIALHNGLAREQVAELLEAAARQRLSLAGEARARVKARTTNADSYPGMRAACDAYRFAAEAKALRAIAKGLKPASKARRLSS